MNHSHSWILVAAIVALTAAAVSAEPVAWNTFVEVGKDFGGHYYSQMIYAPPIQGIVSWGTRVHGPAMKAHETLHFLVEKNEWIDAWPVGKADAWAGKYKRWPGWGICATTGSFSITKTIASWG